ncbi:MAG: hypothetical protein MUC48_24255 [Leptolyngbya sp. Prado105]|nr:hypothetical protein [Leptolyngbya sp. Prado105]
MELSEFDALQILYHCAIAAEKLHENNLILRISCNDETRSSNTGNESLDEMVAAAIAHEIRRRKALAGDGKISLANSPNVVDWLARIKVVGAGEPLACAQFCEDSLHIGNGAAHPFEFRVLESLFNQCGPHFVIGEAAAVGAIGRLIQLNAVVFDGGGFELFSDPLFDVASGLTYLEKSLVRLIVDGIGINPQPHLWLGEKDFFDALSHPQRLL